MHFTRRAVAVAGAIAVSAVVGATTASAASTPPPPPVDPCAQLSLRCEVVKYNGREGLFITQVAPNVAVPPTTTTPTTTMTTTPSTTSSVAPYKKYLPRTTTPSRSASRSSPPRTTLPTSTTDAPLPGAIDLDEAQRKAEAQANGYGAPLPTVQGVVPKPGCNGKNARPPDGGCMIE